MISIANTKAEFLSPVAVTAKKWSRLLAMVCFLIALLALSGWLWHIDVLKRPLPGAAAIHPFTVCMLLLSSTALYLFHSKDRRLHIAAYALAGICATGGILTLIEKIYPLLLHLEQRLYPDSFTTDSGEPIYWISPTSSFAFILVGLALLFIRQRHDTRRPEQVIAIVIAFMSWFSILGYIYRVPEFYKINKYLPMAPATAVCFELMAFAVLMFHADRGLARHIFQTQRGGVAARFLFPIVLFLPMVLGYLRLWLHWDGLVSTEFGVGILITSISLVFGVVVYQVARQLNASDAQQEKHQAALLKLNKDLHLKNHEIGQLNEELTASNDELISTNEQLLLANDKIKEQADVILRQKDEQLNRVLELSQDVVWSIDLTGQGENYISRSAERVFGAAVSPEMLNHSDFWSERFHEDDRAIKEEANRQLRETGSMECVFRTRVMSGEYRWIRQRSWMVYNEQGVPIRNEGIGSDVTLAREQEASLRQSEANLRALFDNTEDAFILLDSAYRIQMFNAASLAIANQQFKVGANILDMIPEHRKRIFRIYLEMVARSGTVRYQLNLGEGRDTTCYYITITAVHTDSELVGYCITTSDYSAVKRGEISLRENEERFRALVENSDDIICLLSPEGKIRYANPGAERITGYAATELSSMKSTDLIHPQDITLVTAFVKEVMRSPEKLVRTAFRARHKLGNWLWLDGTALNLSTLPSINGIVINFRDITKSKHSEDERTNLVAQLIEQNNNLRQFSFIASHNLRGPVASMLGLLNLVLREELTDELAQIFGMLQKSAANLDMVIRDLAQILEMRRNELQAKEWVDLRETVQPILAELQPQIDECDAEIVINDEAVGLFNTIKSYFHSILYHLITNAIKYRSLKRTLRVDITTFRTESTSGFVVRDNGSGLDMKQYGNKVFGLYQRFNLETEGKGLGLYIVRSQVSILNGSITVESMPDEGAAFIVSFRETMNFGTDGEYKAVAVQESRK